MAQPESTHLNLEQIKERALARGDSIWPELTTFYRLENIVKAEHPPSTLSELTTPRIDLIPKLAAVITRISALAEVLEEKLHQTNAGQALLGRMFHLRGLAQLLSSPLDTALDKLALPDAHHTAHEVIRALEESTEIFSPLSELGLTPEVILEICDGKTVLDIRFLANLDKNIFVESGTEGFFEFKKRSISVLDNHPTHSELIRSLLLQGILPRSFETVAHELAHRLQSTSAGIFGFLCRAPGAIMLGGACVMLTQTLGTEVAGLSTTTSSLVGITLALGTVGYQWARYNRSLFAKEAQAFCTELLIPVRSGLFTNASSWGMSEKRDVSYEPRLKEIADNLAHAYGRGEEDLPLAHSTVFTVADLLVLGVSQTEISGLTAQAVYNREKTKVPCLEARAEAAWAQYQVDAESPLRAPLREILHLCHYIEQLAQRREIAEITGRVVREQREKLVVGQ